MFDITTPQIVSLSLLCTKKVNKLIFGLFILSPYNKIKSVMLWETAMCNYLD